MELINQYIQIEIDSQQNLNESICISKQDQKNIYLHFHLSSNDCLFEIANNKNKVLITISKTYFSKYNTPFALTTQKQNICCNTQSKLYDLINCNLIGIPRNIFLESIVLYLLFQTQKNNLIFQLDCQSCSAINAQVDIVKIKKAKEFILQNLHQNITIPIIAKHISTNQCYLKKWFKEYTGQTIFEFVQENRMVKAKHFITNTNQSITDIALNLGYASISSFSQTYKSYYGIAPSIHQKN